MEFGRNFVYWWSLIKIMNRIVLVLLLLLFGSAYGQTPPKKASKIIVLTKDTANTVINQIARVLFDRGYTMDTKDEQLKQIVTKERPNKNSMTLTKIRVSINDTAIIFTSVMAIAVELNLGGVTSKQTFDPVTYSGLKKSYMMEAWNELDAIARQFGSNIIYSK